MEQPQEQQLSDAVRSALERAEKEFNILKDRYFGDKIKQLEGELDAIQAATHQGFIQKCAELDELKVIKLKGAETTKEYQIQNLEHEFEAEKKQAEDEYLAY